MYVLTFQNSNQYTCQLSTWCSAVDNKLARISESEEISLTSQNLGLHEHHRVLALSPKEGEKL